MNFDIAQEGDLQMNAILRLNCTNETNDFILHLNFIHKNIDMELEDDGWWNEMGKYILSVESLTLKALKRIKRGRIQSHLPFDGAFQKYFLQKTNTR